MAEGMASVAADMEAQPEALATFSRSKFPRAPKGSVFVGAGDSYAAALAGFYSSKGGCVALDPYALASAPEMASGREVYFISASGRTASNLAAAKKVRRMAERTTAITAVGDSELTRLTDRVILLPVNYLPRTPGIRSFSLSLLAVLKIAGGQSAADFGLAMERARKDRSRLKLGKGTTYFLGNSLGYAAALYLAAKTYELLGSKAHAELLEEFGHLEMFCLAPEDAVVAFSCFDPADVAGRLSRALGSAGYPVHVIPNRGASASERLFHSVFVGQLALLDAAAEAGLDRPSFLRAGQRLRASDALIYHAADGTKRT